MTNLSNTENLLDSIGTELDGGGEVLDSLDCVRGHVRALHVVLALQTAQQSVREASAC